MDRQRMMTVMVGMIAAALSAIPATLKAADIAPAPATAPATGPSNDRTSIVDEIKSDQDAIASITKDITGYDKDATDAEALAKNPPVSVSDADKPAYIDKRKNEEQTAQDSAKEARERLVEAHKSLEDAKARLAKLDGVKPGAPAAPVPKTAATQPADGK